MKPKEKFQNQIDEERIKSQLDSLIVMCYQSTNNKKNTALKILAFDTETTGLVTDTKHLLAPTNDYPLSIAVFVFDDTKIGETFELMKVPPESMLACYWNYGIDPKPEAQKFNGITRKTLDSFGLSPYEILPLFAELMDSADRIVGHNVGYDCDVMRIAYARAGWEGDPFKGRDIYDTCREARDICKLPKYRMDFAEDWKLPKLIEAYKFFFGVGFNGAHGAVADTLAAFDVYLALQGKKCKVLG